MNALFSRTVEYALRAVLHLAQQHGQPRTTDQIAAATQVPKAYLSKVLQWLSQAGIVRSQRGIGGGVVLAVDPGTLTMLDVIRSVEPLERTRSCPLALPIHGVRQCALHRTLDDALDHVENAFRSTTLSDLISDDAATALEATGGGTGLSGA